MSKYIKSKSGECPTCQVDNSHLKAVNGFILYKQCWLCGQYFYYDIQAEIMKDEIESEKKHR